MYRQIAALVITCVCLMASASAGGRQSTVRRVDAVDVGTRVEVIGLLGTPIGQWVTIEGARPATVPGKGGKHATRGGEFRVDRMNGRTLRQPVFVAVDNIQRIPVDTPCTFSGYETGAMAGVPEDVLLHTGHRKPSPRAATVWGWRFDLRFVVMKVVRPASVHARPVAP